MKEAGLKGMKPLGPHLNAETPAVYEVTCKHYISARVIHRMKNGLTHE